MNAPSHSSPQRRASLEALSLVETIARRNLMRAESAPDRARAARRYAQATQAVRAYAEGRNRG